ncbi:aromatase/cyclase [Kutzneria sp. NPDC051319]|uniref:aromatase/cyclase n=1 Tax=Kutzneria sp. NPDC051319 TaxID=3155047 RepID=UPI0034329CB9
MTDGSLGHQAVVDAAPDVLYELIADPAMAPRLFPTVLHLERTEGSDTDHVLQRWVIAGDSIRTWRARRTLDRDGRRIVFEHDSPRPPVRWMRGEWTFGHAPGGGCVVELRHDFRLGDDGGRFAEDLDRNVGAQLAELKRIGESLPRLAAATVSVRDHTLIRRPVDEVFAVLVQLDRWPGVDQVHRLPLPGNRLVFKQGEPLVVGSWWVAATADGAEVALEQTVVAGRDREQLAADVSAALDHLVSLTS